MPRSLAACLGPTATARCPHGALAGAGGRCGPCAAVWYASRPRRTYSDAERLEHDAIKAHWVRTVGLVCAGADPTVDPVEHPAHPCPKHQLTVDHWGSPVALGYREAGYQGPKRVICNTLNGQLGGLLGAALTAEDRP